MKEVTIQEAIAMKKQDFLVVDHNDQPYEIITSNHTRIRSFDDDFSGYISTKKHCSMAESWGVESSDKRRSYADAVRVFAIDSELCNQILTCVSRNIPIDFLQIPSRTDKETETIKL
ncbi:MAG: hypothetical protein ABJG41_01315 [Cyclobacteriaceae bacterium]